MYLFLGIVGTCAVFYIVCKTVSAAKEPVNGEVQELRNLDTRIHRVMSLLSHHV